MPILNMHIKADEILFNNYEVESKNDFIVGSVFPDCYWSDNPLSGSTVDEIIINELHIARIVDDLRFPNYFEFIKRYSKELMYSDFMRGYLFHLLLDFYNNFAWYERVKISGDTYIISGDMMKVECVGMPALLEYKYGDMYRYLNYNKCNTKCIENVQGLTRNFISSICYNIDFDIDMMVESVNSWLNIGHKSAYSQLFLDKYYSNIIKNAVDEYLRIGVVYGWFDFKRIDFQ